MARRHLTGVLLVGGESRRFGSPKALATFEGETLAERAWRTLAEACDEVVAVGKGDADLPFAVLDDGSDERAPVYGVIAGLRVARDVAVVLPVDCPLITPSTLRSLGDAAAVPSAQIPLPGAYPVALRPVLEERVARGEITLRGVNPVTLAVDPSELVDVDTPEDLERLRSERALEVEPRRDVE